MIEINKVIKCIRQVIELCIVKLVLLKHFHIIYNNIRQNGIVYIKNKALLFLKQIISRTDAYT